MHVGGVQQKEGRMKVVFVSNYINHHQIPFCNAMREQLSEDFFFVQTEPMAEERIKMGWGIFLPEADCGERHRAVRGCGR